MNIIMVNEQQIRILLFIVSVECKIEEKVIWVFNIVKEVTTWKITKKFIKNIKLSKGNLVIGFLLITLYQDNVNDFIYCNGYE